MADSSTICIYFSGTGGGHSSAAGAIKAGVEQLAKEEQVGKKIQVLSCPIIERAHPVVGRLVTLYNHLARHHTTWIKYYYYLVHLLKFESNLYYGLYRSYLHDLFITHKPSLVVAVHPMIAEALTQTREEANLGFKIAIVVTDPNKNLWRAWACQRADLNIVPNDIVRDKLLGWGIAEDKIRVLGMPVHPRFLSPPAISRSDFLSQLGLSPDVFTVCINSSWAGNAHLLDVYMALKKCNRQLQAIFLSGHNKELHEKAVEKIAQTNIPTVVLPFSDQMSDLMNAVDVMVTKAGGLTTYEALARRLPLIFDNTIEPMPQEAPTMQMLIDCDMAKKIDKPDDIAPIIDAMESHSGREKLLPNTYQLNLTDDAIFNIAETLLQLDLLNVPISNNVLHR